MVSAKSMDSLTKKWPNEPKNVKIVTERIADIKGDSFLNVARETTNNAVQLFKEQGF